MLSSEALLAEARERGMPGNKLRDVLREYLQVLLLRELFRRKGATRLSFTGGTALRLVEGFGRFSEDLDFNAWGLDRRDFEALAREAGRGMEMSGFPVQVSFEYRGRLSFSRVAFPGIEERYGLDAAARGGRGLMVKVETNRPRWKQDPELRVVAGFGETVPVPLTPLPALVADKIDAVVRKSRGRHLYDLAKLLGRRIRPDDGVWRKVGGKGDALDALLGRVRQLKRNELERMAESLRPFLFDEREADLVANAGAVITDLVRRLREP